ncbi:hypothetical protein ACFQO4_20605 [Saliphagus sp. GCM10025334]
MAQLKTSVVGLIACASALVGYGLGLLAPQIPRDPFGLEPGILASTPETQVFIAIGAVSVVAGIVTFGLATRVLERIDVSPA